jgi:osmotically-inducible protein OsmY
MPTDERPAILDRARAALRSEPRLAGHAQAIRVRLAENALVLEGEVPNVAAKKLALERTAALPAVEGIVDRLRVTPAARMGDGEIADHLRDALIQEPIFGDCAIEIRRGSRIEVAQRPLAKAGEVFIEIESGVVTLNGQVPSLARKRLAGVLSWWVPGSRDVINGIAVEPPEEDSDNEIAEAVRIALEKDPFVEASQIRVGVRNATVRLAGLVPTESERDMAEFDAWYVFGVDRVINDIAVRA